MDHRKLQSDPKAFRESLLIDTDDGAQKLAERIDDWQRTDFEALDSGWIRAVKGKSVAACRQRAWLERARGHSKSADLAVMATWALFASKRRLSGIAAAGDQDQARLLRDACGRLVHCNPWLSKFIEVQNYRVINVHTESTLEIISSDAPTSYGLTPDFCICDEVVHWKKRDLWDALISSAAKRSTCMVVIITNAGLSEDWQWKTREAVRQDPAWYFSRLDGPVASWIDKDRLAEQERLLPSIAFRRLWLNEWTTGGGDALPPEIIDAAFDDDLKRQTCADPTFDYVCGVDIGVSRDASAICVLGIKRGYPDHGSIQLASCHWWYPRKGHKVSLSAVETKLVELNDTFRFRQVNYDPWEMRGFASRLQAGGFGRLGHSWSRVSLVEVSPTGANLQRMATAVLEAFNDHRVRLYPEPDLRADLLSLRVEERSYGFRLTSPRDERGHGDMASAFGLAMLAASELAAKLQSVAGGFTPATGPRVGMMQFGPLQFHPEQMAPGYTGTKRSQLLAKEYAELSRYNEEAARIMAEPSDGGPHNYQVFEHSPLFPSQNNFTA